MTKTILALISVLLLGTADVEAGEGLITKVRGSNLTIDKGAEDGLVVGLKVDVIRPPSEAVIHPVTGENLGAPEINLGGGEITKTSGRASNVYLGQRPLMAVRFGDLVRFTTPEEEMIIEQESAMLGQEKAQGERRELRGNISGLTKKIQATQRRISGLEGTLKRLDRMQQGFIVQLQGAHKDINLMKEDIDDIKESISLMGSIPVDDIEESGRFDLENEENLSELKGIVREVIEEFRSEIPAQQQVSEEEIEQGEEEDLSLDEEIEEEETPFYAQTWFFGLIGAIGILAVVAYLYMKMAAASEEDEEDEEDDDMEVDDDDDEEDFEVEEEDDIVVEETS